MIKNNYKVFNYKRFAMCNTANMVKTDFYMTNPSYLQRHLNPLPDAEFFWCCKIEWQFKF